MRERITLIAWVIEVELTLVFPAGRAWKTSSTPPWRSRPRCVLRALTTPGMPAVTTSDTSTSATTKTRTKPLRARSLILTRTSSARRRQHEQQTAVVVVCREQVGRRARGAVGVRAQRGLLAE